MCIMYMVYLLHNTYIAKPNSYDFNNKLYNQQEISLIPIDVKFNLNHQNKYWNDI